jgi:hypothetical protein
MRTIFVIQVIKLCRNGRRKQLKYIAQHGTSFTNDINHAEIYYNIHSTVQQYCADYQKQNPQNKYSILAVNIVINQKYAPYA